MLEPILQESHLLTLEAYVTNSETQPNTSLAEGINKLVGIYSYNRALKLTLSQIAVHRGCFNYKGEPQIAGLFVPVGLDGELLEEPKWVAYKGMNWKETESAYQQAKERMLFKVDPQRIGKWKEGGIEKITIFYCESDLEFYTDITNETTLSELAQATKDEPLEILKR